MAGLEAIRKKLGEMFQGIDEDSLAYLLSPKNAIDYDYGDSIQDFGDFCLEIAHEDFSRRQVFIIFTFFGKIKSVLSFGYVKIYFERYDDAVAAFSALKDVIDGLELSSELRRLMNEGDSQKDVNGNVVDDEVNKYEGMSYFEKVSLQEKLLSSMTRPSNDVSVDAVVTKKSSETGGPAKVTKTEPDVTPTAEKTPEEKGDSESWNLRQGRATDSRVAHRIVLNCLGLAPSPNLSRSKDIRRAAPPAIPPEALRQSREGLTISSSTARPSTLIVNPVRKDPKSGPQAVSVTSPEPSETLYITISSTSVPTPAHHHAREHTEAASTGARLTLPPSDLRRVIDEKREGSGRKGPVAKGKNLSWSAYRDYDKVEGINGRGLSNSHSYQRASKEARSADSRYHSYHFDTFESDEAVPRPMNGRPTERQDRDKSSFIGEKQRPERQRPKTRAPNRLLASALGEIERQFKNFNIA